MKILVAGDWHSQLHEEAVYKACRELGHETFRYSWHQYFKPKFRFPVLAMSELFIKKIQNKFLIGPVLARVNRDLLAAVDAARPDLVFVYRGTHITAATIRAIKQRIPTAIVVGYNNDDPFAPGYPFWVWRHFLAAVPEYDWVFAYRHHNLDDFKRAGAKQVGLLRSWYIPEKNRPVEITAEDRQRFSSDVSFIGHYEADGRLEMLEEIARQGINLKIFGPSHGWDEVLSGSTVLKHLLPVRPVRGDEYNKAICASKIALCFLSKLNRDTYTRRCFEIPATRTMMLSEYTDDLATLYQEGVEAEFFRSQEELILKLKAYLSNESNRKAVAEAGYGRVLADGHDVTSRIKRLLETVRGEASNGNQLENY